MSSDRPLKVLYSFPHALDRPGIANTALNQVRSLARRGIELELHCASQGKADLPPGVQVHESMTLLGWRVPHRAIGVQNAYSRHDRIVANRLKHGPRPDIVHTWPRACLHTLSIARDTGVAALRECPSPHTSSAHRASAAAVKSAGVPLPPRHSHADSIRVRELENEEFKIATGLLVPSEYAAGEFIAEGVDPAKLLRHRYGCDITRFYPNVSMSFETGSLRASFIGRGDPAKGLHIALEAWASAELGPDAVLRVAGTIDPAYADSLSIYNATNKVEMLGFVPDPSQLLRDSDVLLLPSWTEGSALVTYEAQASGCLPLVSHAAGAFGIDGIDYLSHQVGDASGLRKQLEDLSHDSQHLQKLRSSLLAERGRFSWDSAAEVLETCYSQALLQAW